VSANASEPGSEQCPKATIAELGLTVRTYNALRRAGYHLVEELTKYSDHDLLKLRNIGKTNLNEIRSALGMPSQKVNVLVSSWSFDQQQRQSEAYNLLAVIENKVRRFIRHNLQQWYGKSWWASAMPEYIQSYVDKRMKSIPLQCSAVDPMEFVDFSDYENIITSESNWNNVFSKILSSKKEIVEHLMRINQLRRSIAHTRPIALEEFDERCREAKFVNKTFRLKGKP